MLVLALLAACQETGVSAVRDGESGTAAAAAEVKLPRTSFAVGAGSAYPATWTDGVVDRSRTCFEETDAGTVYSGCCPDGFDAVGFYYVFGIRSEESTVVCLERPPGSGRAAVEIRLGDGIVQPHGRWESGVFSAGSCALDVRVDDLPEIAAWGANPPEDYRACCPPGFTAVGYAHATTVDEIVCLEDAE